MIEPPVVANRPVGPDRALFLSAVLVLSIVAGLGGGMILVLLDTSFSSLTELRDYTGLRVLGAISDARRSEEHTSELQSLMRISYAVFCLKKNTNTIQQLVQNVKQHPMIR